MAQWYIPNRAFRPPRFRQLDGLRHLWRCGYRHICSRPREAFHCRRSLAHTRYYVHLDGITVNNQGGASDGASVTPYSEGDGSGVVVLLDSSAAITHPAHRVPRGHLARNSQHYVRPTGYVRRSLSYPWRRVSVDITFSGKITRAPFYDFVYRNPGTGSCCLGLQSDGKSCPVAHPVQAFH